MSPHAQIPARSGKRVRALTRKISPARSARTGTGHTQTSLAESLETDLSRATPVAGRRGTAQVMGISPASTHRCLAPATTTTIRSARLSSAAATRGIRACLHVSLTMANARTEAPPIRWASASQSRVRQARSNRPMARARTKKTNVQPGRLNRPMENASPARVSARRGRPRARTARVRRMPTRTAPPMRKRATPVNPVNRVKRLPRNLRVATTALSRPRAVDHL